MITRDDVRRHAVPQAARLVLRTFVVAKPGHTWPHAERRRWSCALNDYGWRCVSPPRFWFDHVRRGCELRSVRMCIVDTARPGTLQLGEETIT